MTSEEPGKKHTKNLIFFSIQPDRQQHDSFVTMPLLFASNKIYVCTKIWTKKRSIKSFSARSSLDCFMHMTKNAVRSNLEYKSLRFPRFCAVIHCRDEIYSHLRGRERQMAHLQCLGRAEELGQSVEPSLAVQRFTSPGRHNKAQSIYETKSPSFYSTLFWLEI